MIHHRLPLLALLALAASTTLSACFNPFNPLKASTRTISEPPPRPTSARNAMLLFEWCWENRSIGEYEELFTDDFRFAFAATDTTGNAYLESGFTREDELASARHLFLGGDADQPPARSITMDLDPNLVALPDSRPGKAYPWHVEIFTRLVLTIESDAGSDRISGSARFFLVRGDSAVIPQDLVERRFGRDANRWYIERYEEEGSALANAVSHRGSTWFESARGQLRTRPSLPAAARIPGAADVRAAREATSSACLTIGCLKHRYR